MTIQRLLLTATLFLYFTRLCAGNDFFLSKADTLNPPACTASPDITVSCEQYDPSLFAYPGITSQSSSVVSVSVQTDYSQFDTFCLRGRVTRTFTVSDSTGVTGSCTQHIDVNYLQDYFIRFPNDVIVTSCNTGPSYGEPVFYGEDCELLAVSSEDLITSVVPDACYRIQRQWTIINWCTFNPALPLIEVPNPAPNAIANHPANLPGPTVSSIQTPGDPWRSTIVKINPTDAAPTNFSVFYDANANGYKYTQLIKVADSQDPEITSAPVGEQQVNDVSTNQAQLWNEIYWWDNVNSTHDLCEAEADISIQATDACGDVNISFQLLLDLDGDGVMETRINSNELGAAGLGWNNVPYGNVTGTAQNRQFDGRPVWSTDKWGFALQQIKDSTTTTARLRFNTSGNPDIFVSPVLPHGIHKIKWVVDDACGNATYREYVIHVRDSKAPAVVCLNNLSVNIMPTDLIQLWATDFLWYGEDNCTPASALRYGARKAGAGTGFPVDGNGNPQTSVVFNCAELGNQAVELWCIDNAGNADFCQSNVLIQDNNGNCNMDSSELGGYVYTVSGDLVEEFQITITPATPFVPPFMFFDLFDGYYEIPASAPLFPIINSLRVAPQKDDNPLNGVSTYDLVLIKDYIDGNLPLSPYQMIAADANNSGTITTFDIVELRNLILGIYTELPNNTSWRFIPAGYVFPQPNPFKFPVPGSVSIGDIRNYKNGGDFIGVKIGDINGSAIGETADGRESGHADLRVISERSEGDLVSLKLSFGQPVAGSQFELQFDGLELLEAASAGNISQDNLYINIPGNTLSVVTESAENLEITLKCRQTKTGSLPEMVTFCTRRLQPEVYIGKQAYPLSLSFPEITGFELYQNRPNPFSEETAVPFNMEAAGEATLRVFDINGKLLLVRTGACMKGMNQFTVAGLPQGVMYYEVEAGQRKSVGKMVKM